MNRRKIFAVLIVVFSVALSSMAFYAYQVIKTPNLQVDKADIYFYVNKGDDFPIVQDKLHEAGIVNDLVAFSVLAKLMKYDENVKPGKYLLTRNMSNRDAIQLLRAGNQATVDITFNNVRLKEDLAEKICANTSANPSVFDSLIHQPAIAQKYGFDDNTFMTMFIPNTYEVYWTTDSEDILDRMKKEYETFWTDERKQKAEKIGLSQTEVSILASIVQAETKKNDEAPRVAGVYMNRLKRNMALQADPTLVFALGDFSIKRVLNVHKEIESPYNTYKYVGLPPGPINLPSINSIDAVLDYESHSYLYFCAKDDFSGYHNFATNLKDHLANARLYQYALNKAKLFK